jgi:hypothetical protein
MKGVFIRNTATMPIPRGFLVPFQAQHDLGRCGCRLIESPCAIVIVAVLRFKRALAADSG